MARQYRCGVPGAITLVTLSVALVNVLVEVETQLLRFVELWIT